MSILGEILAEVFRGIGQIVFQGIAYGTGKLALTILSAGRLNMTIQRPAAKVERHMKSFFYRRNKRSYLHPVYVELFGLAMWTAGGVGMYFVIR